MLIVEHMFQFVNRGIDRRIRICELLLKAGIYPLQVALDSYAEGKNNSLCSYTLPPTLNTRD